MITPDITAQLAADLHTLHRAGKLASPWLEGMRLVVLPDDGTRPRWMTNHPIGRFGGVRRDRISVSSGSYPLAAAPWLAPDLTDTLTAAGLIALVREASGEPAAAVVAIYTPSGLAWGVIPDLYDGQQPTSWPTEAAALCAALHLLAVHL
jgi:hypothetical protein